MRAVESPRPTISSLGRAEIASCGVQVALSRSTMLFTHGGARSSGMAPFRVLALRAVTAYAFVASAVVDHPFFTL